MNASRPNPHGDDSSSLELQPLVDESGMAADPMLDVLLAEALADGPRQFCPPDQTQAILDRFHHAPVVAEKAKIVSPKADVSNSTKANHWGWLLAVSAAIVVLGSIAWQARSQFKVAKISKPTEAETPKDSGSVSADVQASKPSFAQSARAQSAQLDGTSTVVPSESNAKPNRPPNRPPNRVIELAGPSVPNAAASNLSSPGEPNQPAKPSTGPPRSIHLVSKTIVTRFDRYWNRIGVQPTPLMSEAESVERLRNRFGLEISPGEFDDPKRLAMALTRDENRSTLALRLATTWSARFQSSNEPAVELVMEQLQQALKQRSGMDKLIASWFAPSDQPPENVNELAPETSSLVARMTRSYGTHEAVVKTVSLTHNRDLRCGRCHNIPTTGAAVTSQEDYWQFAASFLPVLRPDRGSTGKLFFDTLDGRRRLAERSQELAPSPKNLIGSETLASGLVDWVWRTIHGKPLVSSPYDLAGAANSEMQKLHSELSKDLLASDFDLVRTIALVMPHSIIGRQVPDAMTPEGLLVADDRDWVEAVVSIDSFAASAPLSRTTTPKQRARLVAQMDLPSLDRTRGRGAILAQPIGSDEMNAKPTSLNRPLLADQSTTREVSQAALSGFPMRSTIVMPAWLKQLPTFESRRQHIAHLAGQLELDPSTTELAKQMKDAGIDETLILERIWWVVRPTGI